MENAFDAVIGLNNHEVRLLAGYVDKGVPYVLDSYSARGNIVLSDGSFDVDLAAKLITQSMSALKEELKASPRSVSFVIPPLACQVFIGSNETQTAGETVTDIDGNNAVSRLAKQLSNEQRERLVGLYPVQYSCDGKPWKDYFPSGELCDNLTVRSQAILGRQETIASVRNIMAHVGLDNSRIYVSAQAVGRYFRDVADFPRSYFLLEFGEVFSSCSYIGNTMLAISQSIRYGEDDLAKAVAETFGLLPESAKTYVETFGISKSPDYGYETADGFTQSQLSKVLVKELAPVANLLSATQKSTKSGDKVQKIVLVGDGSYIREVGPILSHYAGDQTVTQPVLRTYGSRSNANADLLGTLLLMDDTAWVKNASNSKRGLLRRGELMDMGEGSRGGF